jgi:hypothetical protein
MPDMKQILLEIYSQLLSQYEVQGDACPAHILCSDRSHVPHFEPENNIES